MKKRNTNYELMRIISMFFIIIWHILIHGNVFNNCTNPALKIIFAIVLFAIAVHVNSFIILTGYYQSKSKFKFRKLLSIIFQAIFYSLLILFIGIKLKWIQNITIVNIINNILPEAISNYWFISLYVIIYTFSDYFNMIINNLNRKQLENLLILLFLVFSISPFLTGYRIINSEFAKLGAFIIMYLIGGYLNKYPLKENRILKKLSKTNYRLLLIGIFITCFTANYFTYKFGMNIKDTGVLLNNISQRILTATPTKYSNPFIIIQTIAYFEIFSTINFKNKFINYIGCNTLGIYLLHDHPLVRKHIYKLLKIDQPFSNYGFCFKILNCAIIIFITGIIVELIRKLLCYLYHKTKLSKQISIRNEKFLKNINNSINY